VNGVSLPPTSLLASGRRPITALTTADQETVDQLCVVFMRKCFEPWIASFKLNRSQTLYAHDLVKHELVRRELVCNNNDIHYKAVVGSTLLLLKWVETI